MADEFTRCSDCVSPKTCGKREVEIGSNKVYVSGCSQKGSPRIYSSETVEVIEKAEKSKI